MATIETTDRTSSYLTAIATIFVTSDVFSCLVMVTIAKS